MSVRCDSNVFDTCRETGKRMYASRERAYVFCQRIGKRNRKRGDRTPVHVYRCDRGCGAWHIGHSSSYVGRKDGHGYE